MVHCNRSARVRCRRKRAGKRNRARASALWPGRRPRRKWRWGSRAEWGRARPRDSRYCTAQSFTPMSILPPEQYYVKIKVQVGRWTHRSAAKRRLAHPCPVQIPNWKFRCFQYTMLSSVNVFVLKVRGPWARARLFPRAHGPCRIAFGANWATCPA